MPHIWAKKNFIDFQSTSHSIHSIEKEKPIEASKRTSPIDAKVQASKRSIQEIDVSGMNFLQRFLQRTYRYMNIFKRIFGYINAHTIITGASLKWDLERLREGKHALLSKMGAEHVQLKSKTDCIVDGHFLSSAGFMQKIEEMGGQRIIFETQADPSSIEPSKICSLEINSKTLCKMNEIILDENGLPADPQLSRDIAEEILRIVPNSTTGKLYAITQSGAKKLSEQTGIKNLDDLEIPSDATIKELENSPSSSQNRTFPGIKFDKSSARWREAVQMFNEIKINNTAWFLHETDKMIYLVPAKEKERFIAGLTDEEAPLREKPVSTAIESMSRGTVLLTMNQTDIYEQYCDEMLTFMLEGVDVMAYNNPGKGMSTGGADRENINASIEAAYQYLKKKGIPDEKILAKGQCFGGAPTAWLGKQHPYINLMLDQNPANFYDVAVERMNKFGKVLEEIDNSFYHWLGKMIKDNFIIHGLARTIFSGYNIAEDLAYNKGHKLLNIDIQNDEGEGGDDLVPANHPQAMIDAIQDNPNKIATVSFNPGGVHVTNWWSSRESQETILHFLSKTGISQSLF